MRPDMGARADVRPRGARRREPAARGDNVLADLLAATHEDGTPLSDPEVRDAVLTLLTAGHDTTALALAWALEQIVPRAGAVGQITDELQRVTGGGPPRAEHLARLEYLDAAIRESLRVRTILPYVVRLTKRPFTAGGREYPPGVVLCPCNHLVHRRADLYPEPARFRPERFLGRKYAGHEWFPFGGGNRTCLGMAFALYEMKVVLATLFSQVRLERPPGSRSRPLRRGLSLAPDDGTRACLGMAFALYEMKVVLSTLLARVRLARPAGSRSNPVRQGVARGPDDGAVRRVVGRRE